MKKTPHFTLIQIFWAKKCQLCHRCPWTFLLKRYLMTNGTFLWKKLQPLPAMVISFWVILPMAKFIESVLFAKSLYLKSDTNDSLSGISPWILQCILWPCNNHKFLMCFSCVRKITFQAERYKIVDIIVKTEATYKECLDNLVQVSWFTFLVFARL